MEGRYQTTPIMRHPNTQRVQSERKNSLEKLRKFNDEHSSVSIAGKKRLGGGIHVCLEGRQDLSYARVASTPIQ